MHIDEFEEFKSCPGDAPLLATQRDDIVSASKPAEAISNLASRLPTEAVLPVGDAAKLFPRAHSGPELKQDLADESHVGMQDAQREMVIAAVHPFASGLTWAQLATGVAVGFQETTPLEILNVDPCTRFCDLVGIHIVSHQGICRRATRRSVCEKPSQGSKLLFVASGEAGQALAPNGPWPDWWQRRAAQQVDGRESQERDHSTEAKERQIPGPHATKGIRETGDVRLTIRSIAVAINPSVDKALSTRRLGVC